MPSIIKLNLKRIRCYFFVVKYNNSTGILYERIYGFEYANHLLTILFLKDIIKIGRCGRLDGADGWN